MFNKNETLDGSYVFVNFPLKILSGIPLGRNYNLHSTITGGISKRSKQLPVSILSVTTMHLSCFLENWFISVSQYKLFFLCCYRH